MSPALSIAAQHNLPLRLTSFVGRDREIAEVAALLRARRLVTLIGAPGVGKTRLSLQVAATVPDPFDDGIWLLELAPLADPELVPRAVAEVLGVREMPGRPVLDTLAEHLRTRRLLLLLDNCEHLVGAVAAPAETLLRTCPDLRILATSREPLGVEGEVTWRVPSLTLPETSRPCGGGRDWAASLAASEAVHLFVERAQEAAPGFALTAQNADAVAQICTRLDGIPLAIELAAARVRALSVEQIAARLDDRFRLLTGGNRTALPRQQTLRGAVDWSYDLLSAPEQRLLRRLAVFAGGFTLEAAEEVGSRQQPGGSSAEHPDVPGRSVLPAVVSSDGLLDLLVPLVDKSLVQVDEDAEGKRRYRLLETLRQYGLEKLVEHGELAAVRNRHCDYVVAFLQDVQYSEYRATVQHMEEALILARRAGDDAGAAEVLQRLGFCLVHLGAFERAERLGAESIRIARRLGDPFVLANMLRTAGIIAEVLGDFERSAAYCEESVALCRQGGDDRGMAASMRALARAVAGLGDLEGATALHEQSLAMAQHTGDRRSMAEGFKDLGRTALLGGDADRAVEMLRVAIPIYRDLNDRLCIALCFHDLAGARTRQGTRDVGMGSPGQATTGRDPRRGAASILKEAARLFAAAETLREATGIVLHPWYRPAYERDLATLRERLGEDALVRAWAEGRAMSLEQAADYALAVTAPADPLARAASDGPDGPVPSPAPAERPPAEAAVARLSRREQEVAGLVARGLTNRQIGEHLTLSERTVDTHVRNILGKLTLVSRAQIAAWAVEHRLHASPR